MVAVFGAFALDSEVFVKLIGVGLATAILIDATIVRMILVPAVMELLGDRAWWTPRWLSAASPLAEGPRPFYLMMVNATVAVVPLRPAAVGVAARRYRPGASFLPAMRPVNLKRLTPTTPVRVKEPFTAVQREQAFFFCSCSSACRTCPSCRRGPSTGARR